MSVKVQKITEPLSLGEGPHWDDNQQALYFVNIVEHTIHKYVLATQAHTKTKAGTMGRMDSQGQFELNKGSLFCLDRFKITKVDDGITIANGLAWDLKQKAMYYIDSMDKNIRRYDYDVETGEISKPFKFVLDSEKNIIEAGFPDGMTIDTDGNLWVAVFDGSCVLKIDPRAGELLQKVPIPALQVTSATFGGPNYDILFVTTASLNIDRSQAPLSGSVFMVTGLGVKGLPNVNFKL